MRRLLLPIIICLFTIALAITLKLCKQVDHQTANKLRQEGKLTEAINQYKQLLETDPHKAYITYQLAATYALQADYEAALHYLKITLQTAQGRQCLGGQELGNFLALIELPAWKEMEQELSKSLQPGSDLALAQRLWKLYFKDQAYYSHLFIAENKLGSKSPVLQAIWDLKHRLNKEDEQELDLILTEHGWPAISKVGELGADAAFLVVQHNELNLMKKAIPLLKSACKKGEAKWPSYALLYDRIAMYEGGKQLYGSQLCFSKKDPGKYELWPIEDPDKVDERRNEKGMQPMEEYLATWGISWQAYLKQYKKA